MLALPALVAFSLPAIRLQCRHTYSTQLAWFTVLEHPPPPSLGGLRYDSRRWLYGVVLWKISFLLCRLWEALAALFERLGALSGAPGARRESAALVGRFMPAALPLLQAPPGVMQDCCARPLSNTFARKLLSMACESCFCQRGACGVLTLLVRQAFYIAAAHCAGCYCFCFKTAPCHTASQADILQTAAQFVGSY